MRNWRLAHCEINVDRCAFASESYSEHSTADSAQKSALIMALLKRSVNPHPAEGRTSEEGRAAKVGFFFMFSYGILCRRIDS